MHTIQHLLQKARAEETTRILITTAQCGPILSVFIDIFLYVWEALVINLQ